jgi:hypothetical protein
MHPAMHRSSYIQIQDRPKKESQTHQHATPAASNASTGIVTVRSLLVCEDSSHPKPGKSWAMINKELRHSDSLLFTKVHEIIS